MTGVAVKCRCKTAEHLHLESGQEVADYLRALADRVEAGEISHVSVSVHPKPDA